MALLAGADLGGARGVLLMQSSGVGNCINMLSLTSGGRFPFLTLISMRGDFGEGNPWQYPMGKATQPVLEAMGVTCLRSESPDDVRGDGPGRAHHGVPGRTARWPCCSPRSCSAPRNSERSRSMAIQSPGSDMAGAVAPAFVLDRRDGRSRADRRHQDFLFVTGLAGTSRDIAALTAGRRPHLHHGRRHGRRLHDRARPGAGTPRQAGAGGHGRRRAADEHRLARHHRRDEPAQSLRSSASTTATTARPATRRATPASASIWRRSRPAPASSARSPSRRRPRSPPAPA